MKKGNEELNKKRGERLKKARDANNMTRKQLGDAVHMSGQNVYNIENGKRGLTIENAFLFSEILGVTADYLLCESDSPQETVNDKRNHKIDSFLNEKTELQNLAKSFLGNWLALNGYKYERSIMESADRSHFEVFPGPIEKRKGYKLVSHIYSKNSKSMELKRFLPEADEIMVSAKDLHLFPRELLQYTEMRLKAITTYNNFSTLEVHYFDNDGNPV